jgi:hypothetical protein
MFHADLLLSAPTRPPRRPGGGQRGRETGMIPRPDEDAVNATLKPVAASGPPAINAAAR